MIDKNEIFNDVFGKEFQKNFKKELTNYHKCSRFNVAKDTQLEEIIYFSIPSKYKNIDWSVYSTKAGTDITIDDIGLSIKTGKINKDKITFSSHKTSRFKTMEDRINYMNQHHENYIIFCSSIDRKNNFENVSYQFRILDRNKFDFNNLNMEELKSGYKFHNDIISGRIDRNTCYQFWVTIPKDLCECEYTYNIPVKRKDRPI